MRSNQFQPVHGGSQDAFIAKLDPSGSSLVFSTYLGGAAEEYPSGFDIEGSRHPVLVGRTASANYPVTPDAAQSFNGGFVDAFITRLNGSGQTINYSTYFGGPSFEDYRAVAAEAGGSVVFTGSAIKCPTLGCVQRLSANNQVSLIFKPTSVFSAALQNLVIDSFGNIVDSGSLVQEFSMYTGGIPAVNPVRYQSTGDDAILMLLRPDGQILISTFWGGWVGSVSATGGLQNAVGAVSDSSGALYLAGNTNATDLFASDNAFQPKVGGGQDAFLVKFAPGSQQIISSVRIDSQAPYILDGVLYQTKRAFQWYAGTTHRIEISENYQTTYARFSQGKWLDGAPNSRTITVGTTDGYYLATYKVEVKVETQVVPNGAGMVSVTPISTDGFYPSGSTINIAAIPNPGYRFKQFTGSIITNSSTLSPTSICPPHPVHFN